MKHLKTRFLTSFFTAGALSTWLFMGCTSVNNKSIGPHAELNGEPFTEAYFEYPGPRRIWAGPQTFVVHVTAKEGEKAKIALTPASLASATSGCIS